jgi:transcriptional regulator with XRE-family HTH domain
MPGRMRSRARAALQGREAAARAAADMGSRIRATRRRRRWTLQQLGQKVGVSGARIGQIERGEGASAPLDLWYAIAAALDLPLALTLGRDRLEDAADAGHLAIQELALRLGRDAGRHRTFELPSRPIDSGHSTDVGLRDDGARVLVLLECWNTFGSINAAVRSTRRKLADAEALAVAIGGEDGPYRVACCWIVRDTRRNRELLARYPEVFTSTFVGSSAAWVRALSKAGVAPPTGLGLTWCTRDASRLVAWRRHPR